MSAYYARNDSYSRSANAESAEAAGRFPRTRAAKHLGVSLKAFDAGCLAAGYRTTEWHHVGKYANPVDYYDASDLSTRWQFWFGAAKAYAAKTTRRELLSKAAAARLVEVMEPTCPPHRQNRKYRYDRQRELCQKFRLGYDFTFPTTGSLSLSALQPLIDAYRAKQKQRENREAAQQALADALKRGAALPQGEIVTVCSGFRGTQLSADPAQVTVTEVRLFGGKLKDALAVAAAESYNAVLYVAHHSKCQKWYPARISAKS